jgi:histone-lysine N-methyltransferase SETMAR
LFQSLKKAASETHRMLQEAFGVTAMTQSNFFLYKRFKDGWTFVDDDERSGRPSTSTTPQNIAKVREAILADRRQTIHDVCEITGLSHGNVQRILEDNLNISRISAIFVQRLLSDDQKALRVSVCRELKQQARDGPNLISNIITGDETWVYGYDPETKKQSSQWKSPNSPWPEKSASSSQQCKVHVGLFFDIQGIVQKEFVPQDEITAERASF